MVLGRPLGSLWEALGSLWHLLGSPWEVLGDLLAHLLVSWVILGSFFETSHGLWHLFGSPWEVLGDLGVVFVLAGRRGGISSVDNRRGNTTSHTPDDPFGVGGFLLYLGRYFGEIWELCWNYAGDQQTQRQLIS